MKERPHGSESTYINHKCRCQPCRDAHAAKMRERRAARAEIARVNPDAFTHSNSGYNNWGCRCEVCTEDHNRANQEWRLGGGRAGGQ